MYPWVYMFPRLGTIALEESADWALLSFILQCFKLAHICIQVTSLHR